MWQIQIPRRVERELQGLAPSVRRAVETVLVKLMADPYPPGCKKLKGRLQCWRLRVGDWRVLYEVRDHDRVILLLKIGARKDVYRLN